MDPDAVLHLLDQLLIPATGFPLNDLQRLIVQQTWQGQKYRTMAHHYGCTEGHVKDVAADLWQLLTQVLAMPVSKRNLRHTLEHHLPQLAHRPRHHPPHHLSHLDQQGAPGLLTRSHPNIRTGPPGPSQLPQLPGISDSSQPLAPELPHPELPYFVGRTSALHHLDQLRNQGHRLILIQGEGGLGKTTLAQQYLRHLQRAGFEWVLELLMAKEAATITPVERVVEEWLKQDLGQEPGREFGVTLGRLKRVLHQRSIAILIDNLEPALDQEGRFAPPHQGYGELLRVLADSRVQSFTLITSRDRLCEPGVNSIHYRLPGLDLSAWHQYFEQTLDRYSGQTLSPHLRSHASSGAISLDPATLGAMHQAYGGNAKAMGLLAGTIGEDFGGDMVAYWQAYQDHPLSLTDLRNLIVSQVERLQGLDPDAYRVFCRLGCYRYQDVATVPGAAVTALMWDLATAQQQQIVASLRNRSLVDCHKGQYSLHPALRAEAIQRLRQSPDWARANRQAAQFWSDRVLSITTLTEGIEALEAYYHQVAIGDFEAAGRILLQSRNNQWQQFLPLASTLYRMGLIRPVVAAIEQILDLLQSVRLVSELHNILGDLYWITGQVQAAITCQQTTLEQVRPVLQSLESLSDTETSTLTPISSTPEKTPEKHHQHYYFQMLDVDSRLSIGLYQLDRWELEASAHWFRQVIDRCDHTSHQRWADKATVGLALVEAHLGHWDQAQALADQAYNLHPNSPQHQFQDQPQDQPQHRRYPAYFIQRLGQVYGLLGGVSSGGETSLQTSLQTNLQRAEILYHQAITVAETRHYPQVQANALKGLGELQRGQGKFALALQYQERAIALLEDIGAQCDLAEAQFQLALTHGLMGNGAIMAQLCDRAIQCFEQIQAPKQVQRIQATLATLKVHPNPLPTTTKGCPPA